MPVPNFFFKIVEAFKLLEEGNAQPDEDNSAAARLRKGNYSLPNLNPSALFVFLIDLFCAFQLRWISARQPKNLYIRINSMMSPLRRRRLRKPSKTWCQ